jgi:hypothetical protein
MSSPSATDTLPDLLVDGENLLHAAASVGEKEDFYVWRSDRDRWAEEVAVALEAGAPLDAAADFVRVVITPMAICDWQLALPHELETVCNAMALLAAIQPVSRRRQRG